jgi:hypothetical protein
VAEEAEGVDAYVFALEELLKDAGVAAMLDIAQWVERMIDLLVWVAV